MKPVPLHVVRYFNGEETRLVSKHLHQEHAFKVANRFINNLRHKHNETPDRKVIVSITQLSGTLEQPTILTLTSRALGSLGEGVRIDLEAQRDPNWDYPQYSDPSLTDSGQRTTADHPYDQPSSRDEK